MLQGCDELHHSIDLMKSPSSSYFTQLSNLIKTFQIWSHAHRYTHVHIKQRHMAQVKGREEEEETPKNIA